ncbi:hypothetical protein F4553_006501 [Allocatelliglobosispora scoriae]|uniref:DUF2157 domain-containing protein n=1 Tax=Allocatelliglobosispora scoriae TaxID=643052 RepID=A0A841BVE9_9ACTN|nr:hypothetical protein [Allocatelliglobosispora scoriae]MBB5873067.1 hypothetical protein [Allocatelliglobosispora scoriae]
MPLGKEEEAALQRLVTEGQLTVEQAGAVRHAFAAAPVKQFGWLAEAGGYAGGALMAVGALLLLGTAWDDLGHLAKVAILVGVAAVMAVAAVAFAGAAGLRATTGARGRAASGLLALVSVPLAAAVLVAADSQVDVHQPTYAMLAGLGASIVALLVRSSPFSVVCAGLWSAAAVSVTMVDLAGAEALGTGLALVAAGAVWIVLSFASLITPRPLGLLVGGALAIVGGQAPLFGSAPNIWGYGLTAATAAACFLLYRSTRATVMLFGAVLGVTLAVPELVYDVTDGGLSPAVIVLITGVVLVLASLLALRLRSTAPVPEEAGTAP